MNKEILEHARALLLNLTPLKQDCGALCGGACCTPDEEDRSGMMLFPSERALYESCDWAVLGQYDTPVGVFDYLKCAGRCPREARPLACRIFPLSPYFDAGELKLRLDQRAWALCPLMEYGFSALSQAFVQGVLESMRLIDSTPDGHEFLLRWQQVESLYRIGPL